jgi:hypothetical protein
VIRKELRYLDKGLNFAIIPSCAPVLEILTDVQLSITYLPNEIKEDIRTNTMIFFLEQRATENYQSKGVRNAWLIRAIISNINSAFQNLSTWLVNELSQLKQVIRMYVKNSTQFCQQLKNVTVQKLKYSCLLTSSHCFLLFLLKLKICSDGFKK